MSKELQSKTITIQQPWALLIALGVKDIENRTWKTSHRGRVYLHTAARYASGHRNMTQLLDTNQWLEIEKRGLQASLCGDSFPLSSIIGYVDIVDCVINHPSVWAEKSDVFIRSHVGIISKPPIYNWVLANPVLFDKPIENVKGRLSFWNYPNIHSELDEDGKPICMCNVGIEEKDQVYRFIGDEFRCKYCGGKWYK